MYEAYSLFKDMTDEDVLSLNPEVIKYEKGQQIIREGDKVDRFGLVLSGGVIVSKNDFTGNRNLILAGKAGFIFGESLVATEKEIYPVSVEASEDSEIMFIKSDCVYYCKNRVFLYNLLKITAERNLQYRQKLNITGQRTTREKILAFLSAEALQAGRNSFYISFNRQELADYLFVERSAMSAEIGKLVKDGIIRTDRNWFQIVEKKF